MKRYNCILVYDFNKSRLLFCKRIKSPYQGLFNLVGGKVETGEKSIEAAYRELKEETGISDKQIELKHLMDMVYYHREMQLEIFWGILNSEVELVEECLELLWIGIDENFFDVNRFAGEGNIGHIVMQTQSEMENAQ